MPQRILFDQFHLTIYVRRRLPPDQASALRRTLQSRRFRAQLRRAVGTVFRREPSLRPASLVLTG
jgi:hypothetical protein